MSGRDRLVWIVPSGRDRLVWIVPLADILTSVPTGGILRFGRLLGILCICAGHCDDSSWGW